MNAVHFHLVVNHFPIIFPIAGILVMLTGFIFKSDAVKRTAFMLFILGSLSAAAAMKSGDESEHAVENIAGISEEFIERHEESAELFAILTYILGALSVVGLWASVKQKSFSNATNIVVLLYACVVMYFGKQAGTTGGEIRHTEIRENSPLQNTSNNLEENEH